MVNQDVDEGESVTPALQQRGPIGEGKVVVFEGSTIGEEESMASISSYFPSATSSVDNSPRHGRMITFADEHGKSLEEVMEYEVETGGLHGDEEDPQSKPSMCGGCVLL
jgi:hypothetical protein